MDSSNGRSEYNPPDAGDGVRDAPAVHGVVMRKLLDLLLLIPLLAGLSYVIYTTQRQGSLFTVPTPTYTPSLTPSLTATPSPSATLTPTATSSKTPTMTITASLTASPVSSMTPTLPAIETPLTNSPQTMLTPYTPIGTVVARP